MKKTALGFVLGVVSTLALLLAVATVATRSSASADALAGYAEAPAYEAELQAPPPPPAPSEPRAKAKRGGLALDGFGPGGGGMAKQSAPVISRELSESAPPKGEVADAAEGAGPVAATRAWFPETFLFEPLVVTNADGQATVPVRIPDRLTRWRVLGLAHSQTGEQSGAVASFQGTLPVYVEPVLPGFLVAGDEVRLPIQVVNTTDREVSGALRFEVSNARALESGGGALRVPAQGSVLRYAVVRAERAGTAVIRARFGDADALVKELPVLPAGRPVRSSAGGTLASERTVALAAPEGAIPEASRIRLSVFPGALALLRSELSFAERRASFADDAYALLLAGRAPALLENLGETADRVALRQKTLVLQQRALRHARVADAATAALLAEATLAHPENPILARLGERLLSTLASSQRPDGTFQGGSGWTLQRLLVATADGVRALRAGSAVNEAGTRRSEAAAVRASGAFERYAGQVQDGYTAAAILASGAASGAVKEALRERIRAAIATAGDGTRYLPVEAGIQRADGGRPSPVEATALAILALEGDPDAPLPDLGAYLLSHYTPYSGWGDGQTNLAALTAVVAVFRAPLPGQVRVVLEQDGRVIAEGTVEPKQAQDLRSFEARGEKLSSGAFTVRAEPAIPGLGFRLERESWVPWKAEAPSGLELAVTVPASFRVGEAATLQLTAAGPAHSAWSLRTALPAGVQVDRPALDAQVSAGALAGYEVEDGAITLQVPPRGPGQPFQTQLRVFPTLAGRLNAAASSLEVEGRPGLAAYAPSGTWLIR